MLYFAFIFVASAKVGFDVKADGSLVREHYDSSAEGYTRMDETNGTDNMDQIN